MDQASHDKVVWFIWGIAADVTRDLFKHCKYPDAILPMCVIRRVDAVLEPRHTQKPQIVNPVSMESGQAQPPPHIAHCRSPRSRRH